MVSRDECWPMIGGMIHYGSSGRQINLGLYAQGDEHLFDARADFAAALAEEGGLPEGPKFTMRAGDQVVGVGGVEPLGQDRFGAWAYLAPLSRRQWGFLAHAMRAVIRWAIEHRGARTVTAIPAPTPEAVRLMKRIGFVSIGEIYMIFEG